MALVVNVKCYPLLTESIGFPAVVYIYRERGYTLHTLDLVTIVDVDEQYKSVLVSLSTVLSKLASKYATSSSNLDRNDDLLLGSSQRSVNSVPSTMIAVMTVWGALTIKNTDGLTLVEVERMYASKKQ